MYLRTFGELTLEDTHFTRPKPLLLITYLALEGPVSRRRVAELFWPNGKDHMKSLTVALSRIRKGAPGAVGADDERAWADVDSDTTEFLDHLERGQRGEALELYRGPFLDGFYLRNWGPELEGWLYQTREILATHVRHALIEIGEAAAATGSFERAARRAEEAFSASEAPPEPDDLVRIHALLLAGNSALVGQVRKEAEAFELPLPDHAEDARQSLRGHRTRASSSNNLPSAGASFVGRTQEIGAIGDLLERRESRLVTLVGPAGVGKSRLAVEVARDRYQDDVFPDGAFRVELDTLVSVDLVPNVIADELGIATRGPAASLDQVIDHIGRRRMLLILDHFEHLIQGAELASKLIAACPKLRLLITSRERLSVAEEHICTVRGLSFPADDDVSVSQALRYGAVSLYVERARRASPEFDLTRQALPGVLATCRLVEGLPLGIELAASWMGVLTAGDIATEIERNSDFLVARNRDAPERHRSMRRAFEQSWLLLPDEPRKVLRMLAVFRGGFRRRAAADVAGATIPVLATLVDKSLLRVDDTGRYDRHPLLYEFTREKLTAHPSEHAEAQRRHGRRFLGLLASLEDRLAGKGQTEALAAIDGELDNVQAAWRWAVEERAITELEAACRPLQLYYIQRGGMAGEGAAAFRYAADRLDPGEARHHQALGRLRAAEAWFRFLLSDLPGSEAAAEESIRFLVPLQRARAAALAESGVIDRAIASARNTLGNIAKRRGDIAAAEQHFNAAMALAARHGNMAQVAIFTNNLAILKKDRGQFEEAERLYREAIALNRSLGNERSVVRNLTNLGALLVYAGNPDRAEQTLHEGLELAKVIGYAEIEATIVMNLGGAAHIAGRYDDAERLYRDALRRRGPDATSDFRCIVHGALGRTAMARGDWTTARNEYRQVLEAASVRDERRNLLEALIGVCELYVKSGEPCRAAGILARIPEEASVPAEAAERMQSVEEEVRRASCEGRRREAPDAPTRGPDARLEDAVAAALRELAAP